MKTISDQFAVPRLREGQAQSSNISSQKTGRFIHNLIFPKRLTGLRIGIINILLIFSAVNVHASAHTYVNVYTGTSSVVTAASLTVEKVVQGVGADANNHYVLARGINTNSSHNDHGLTLVTKYDNSGNMVWSKVYSLNGAGPGLTYIYGYCIATDNGTNNTGNIAVGGYAFMDGVDDEDFVMELNPSTGAVSWFQHWRNPVNGNYECGGVKDLLYNHEAGGNAGSITALSDDQGSGTVFNLFVYLVKSTGILATEQLTDTYDYGFNYTPTISKPVDGVDIKPRIVESVMNNSYYAVGNRENSSASGWNEIAFWTVPYGVGSASFFAYYNTGANSTVYRSYVTGAVEDDGTYTPSGTPEVFLSGFIMDETASNGDTIARPLVIEVSNLSGPIFTSLKIPPPTPFLHIYDGQGYMYPTDITIVSVKPGSYYQLMMPVNYFEGNSPYKMYIFTVPMNLSSHPNANYYVVRNSGNPISGEFGGICSTDSSLRYMLAGNDFSNDVIIIHADDRLTFCDPDTTVSTSNPSSSNFYGGSGTSVTPNPILDSPGDTSFSSAPLNLCGVYIPTPPSPFGIQQLNNFQLMPMDQEEESAGIELVLNTSAPCIHIYPNPVSEQAWVDISGSKPTNAQISIIDITGKVVKIQNSVINSSTNHISIDMNTLSPGLYVIRITDPAGSINTSTRVDKN